MAETVLGPIIWIVEKRLWYAPWRKKVVGIRVYDVFIPLKQPEPDTFENAAKKAGRKKYKGKRGHLGALWLWKMLYDRDNRSSINNTLQSLGGDPLPEEIMTADMLLFSPRRCRGIKKHWRLPYRIVF